MDPLLSQLGVGVAANAIYDFVRQRFAADQQVDREEFRRDLASFLGISGSSIEADAIIEFLANEGDIAIDGSRVYARASILYGSNVGTKFAISGSRSETDRTRIDVGPGASIKGAGGAEIIQRDDGSISFRT